MRFNVGGTHRWLLFVFGLQADHHEFLFMLPAVLGARGKTCFLILHVDYHVCMNSLLSTMEVSVGGDDNVSCTCRHVGCYGTGLGWGWMISHLHTCWVLCNWSGGDDTVPCTCTDVGSYGTSLG